MRQELQGLVPEWPGYLFHAGELSKLREHTEDNKGYSLPVSYTYGKEKANINPMF
jgi:hypothetical protein